ncbi:MAG: hypothetical protein A3F90_07365 [Deltaproteobacteria bacterium RIFCSPLOWO2_12_FULL_60_19]|nr:MAG: hypothetical protein A3F90_07365 [Deltaproteobacteria bacterium RIFCSPLOWO2_12_FULL_60_19]
MSLPGSMLVGVVYDAGGRPVGGLKIIAKDPSGRIMGEAVSDARKPYVLPNLPTGQYQLTLDPAQSPFKGQTVLSFIGAEGLTVNWLVSEMADAVATATPGTDGGGLFGLGPVTTGAIVLLGTGGLVTGILFATGAIGGGGGGSKAGTASQ